MFDFLGYRAGKTGKSKRGNSPFIEPLEMRRLLSVDVAVDLDVSTPSTLIAGPQPSDLIYDSTRNQLLVLTAGRVGRYNGASGQLVGTFSDGQPMASGDITPDGRYLMLSRGTDGNIWTIDLTSNQLVGNNSLINSALGFTADVAMTTTNALVSFEPVPPNTSNGIRRLQLSNWGTADLLGPGGAVVFSGFAVMARSADMSTVAMVSADREYSYNSGGAVSGVSGKSFGSITGLAVSRNGALHAIATPTSVLVEDGSFGLVHEVMVGGAGVAFSPAADLMVVADPATDMLRVFSTTTWDEISAIPIGEDIPASSANGSGVMALNSGGSMLYLATPSGVRFFDLSGDSTFYGGTVTLSANVDALDATGMVTFVDGTGTTLGQASVVGGAASLAINTPHAGSYSLLAHYEGDANYNPGDSAPSALTVKRAITTWTWGPATQTSVQLTISSELATPGGDVTLYEGVTPVSSGTLVDGVVDFAVSLSPGAHTFYAVYPGDSDFLAVTTDYANIQLKAPTSTTLGASTTSTVYGQSVSFTATVTPANASGGGTVTFLDGAITLGTAVVNSSGVATLVAQLSAGNHSITARFEESGLGFESTSSAVDVSVSTATSTLSLIRSATWIPKGQYVQWQATVSAPAVPLAQITGNVTFKDGTKVLATVAVVDGVAKFQSKSLAVGDHLVSASFASSGLQSSSAKAVKTTVVAGTRIDLMVMYTPFALAEQGSLAAMTKLVNDAAWGMNTALWNSRIALSVRLVYSGQVNYHESGKMTTDLKRLATANDGYMDNVLALRNQYKADLVSLFEVEADEGGLGYVLEDVRAAGNDKYGFNVVRAAQAAGPSYSLAHELGHNLGAVHDREHSSAAGATSYSYGWRFTAGGVVYHDIMSYNPGKTIPYFSNPKVKYLGVPTGTATADVARTFAFTAPYVAKYR